jgi:hypothetical protein
MPTTKSKPKLAVCWQSFASQTTAVSRGMTFPADDPIVKQHGEHFVSADLPESQWPRPDWIVPEREPIGRVKLRVREIEGDKRSEALVWHKGKDYFAGQEFEAEGRDAEHLVDVGACEVVQKLPPKKKESD